MESVKKTSRAKLTAASWIFTFCLLCQAASIRAQTWIQLHPTGQAPDAVSNMNAAYDAAQNSMIVFAGGFVPRNNNTTILSNANGLGGTPAWSSLSPVGQLPPVRADHTVAYDGVHDRLIIYGGITGSGDYQPLLNDVWVLDNASGKGGSPTWTELYPTGGPPTPRAIATAVYDPSSNRMIIFGGAIGPNSSQLNTGTNDTWVLTNANGLGGTAHWIQLQPSGSLPPARNSQSAVYDAASNRMIIFGGATNGGGGTILNDTWILENANGLGGAPTWIELDPSTPIPGRFDHTAIYDPSTNRMTVFSGALDTAHDQTNEVWVLTNANGLGGTSAWTQLSPAGAPPMPRENADAIYDPRSNRMTIFSGNLCSAGVCGTRISDVWVLTNANGTRSSGLGITQALPNQGGNAGQVTVQVIGNGFVQGDQVELAAAGDDPIVGSNINVISPELLTATFNLTGVAAGPYDLIVKPPSGTASTLSAGFTVDEGGAPQIWVDTLGPRAVAANHATTIQVLAGNTGNVDWNGLAFMAIKVPVGVDPITVSFQGQVVGTFHPTPVSSLPFVGSNPGNNALVETFVLPALAASSSTSPYLVQFTAPQSLVGTTIDVEIDPWEVPPVTPPNNYTSGQFLVDLIKLKGQEAQIPPPVPEELTFWTAFQKQLTDELEDYVTELVVDKTKLKDTTKQTVSATANTLRGEFGAAYDAFEDWWNTLLGVNNGDFFPNALYANYSQAQPPVPQYKLPTKIDGVQDVDSVDPNDKVGLPGVGTEQYVSGLTPLRYGLYFGNEDNATAPAQRVVITDQLDADNDNLGIISLGPITFGDRLISPPPFLANFSTTVDLRPTTDLLVAISANLNPSTGLLTWNLQSLDPSTMQPPTDPTVGFLPPGGNGSAFFTVMPKTSLETGTQINNQATVTFDQNAPITTPTWFNTLDNTPPSSSVSPLPSTESCSIFQVDWSGTDVGSGIKDYTIFVSDNGGAFAPWLTNTTASSATYAGQPGHRYAFYSIAEDQVGNLEAAKTSPEASTETSATPACGRPSLSGRIISSSLSGTTLSVGLQLTDTGAGDARNIQISDLRLRVLNGTGTISYLGSLPISVGGVAIGATTTATLTFSVPPTVTRFILTEDGTVEDVPGNTYNFSIGQAVVP